MLNVYGRGVTEGMCCETGPAGGSCAVSKQDKHCITTKRKKRHVNE